MPDVVVVGGGIVGCACAYELAGRGLSVTLFERGELAAGASGRNHGLMLVPPDPVVVPMFEESLALFRGVSGDAPVPFRLDRDPIGLLIAAADDEGERRAALEEAESVAASGVGVERLGAEALHEAEPGLSEGMVEGWLLDDGRRLDPAALTVSLALLSGAEIRRHVTVRGLLEAGARVRGAVTDEGAVEADAVILAAGPWSPNLLRPLGVHLPVAGARGWLVHLLPPGPAVGRLVERAGWHAVGGEEEMGPLPAEEYGEATPEADVGTILQPNPDGSLLVGGSRQRVVTGEPEDPRVPQRLVRGAVALAPALAEADVLSAWWGIRPMTPDARPVVGGVRDGLIVATGHGSQGVILGGGTARLVAAMVTDEAAPFDPAPYSPARFASA